MKENVTEGMGARMKSRKRLEKRKTFLLVFAKHFKRDKLTVPRRGGKQGDVVLE